MSIPPTPKRGSSSLDPLPPSNKVARTDPPYSIAPGTNPFTILPTDLINTIINLIKNSSPVCLIPLRQANKRFQSLIPPLPGTAAHLCELAAKENFKALIIWGRPQGARWRETCLVAAEQGHFELLKWCRAQGSPVNRDEICTAAAKSPDPAILFWARRHRGIPNAETLMNLAYRDRVRQIFWLMTIGAITESNESVCAQAAEGGHPQLLWWLRTYNFPWDATTCSAAAFAGRLDILHWAHGAGCPWDVATCSRAALKGHIDLIIWAHNNGCPWDESTCAAAASGGHFALLQYLYANGCPWDAITTTNAARTGNQLMMKWLLDNGCPFDEYAGAAAAKMKNEDMLSWLNFHGIALTFTATLSAARLGHISILNWFKTHNIPFTQQTVHEAAIGGQVEVLEWLLKEGGGCPLDLKTAVLAAEHGQFEVLQWLHSHKCPQGVRVLRKAAAGDHQEMINWALKQQYPVNQTVIITAYENGHYGLVKWLIPRISVNEELLFECVDTAESPEDYACLRWMCLNGCPWNADLLVDLTQNTKEEIAFHQWLTEQWERVQEASSGSDVGSVD